MVSHDFYKNHPRDFLISTEINLFILMQCRIIVQKRFINLEEVGKLKQL